MEIQRTTMREWCTCTCEEKYRSSRQPHRCRCHHHSPHEFRTQVHHQHRRRRRRRRLLRDESGNDHDNNNPVQTRYNRWAPPPSRCSVVREIITYPYLSLLVRLHLSTPSSINSRRRFAYRPKPFFYMYRKHDNIINTYINKSGPLSVSILYNFFSCHMCC